MSRLEQALDEGRFVVTAEMPTIDGGGMDEVRFQLGPMAPYLDACNATDNTAAHAHASSLAIAVALQRCGMEPVMQLVCRDRNRLALEAEIVGASLHGIENVCCLTGDDVTAGDEPEARRVFDLDGPQLISVATGIAGGRYLSGRPIVPPPPLFVGAVENAAAPPLDHRAERAAKKIAAGARFLQLQISYHPERLRAFVAELDRRGLTERAALLPTIVLVKSARSLRYMDEKVPGIAVPRDTMARVADARDESEAAYELALEQAREALAIPGVRGLHLTDFRHDGSLSRLCRDLDIPSKEERGAHAHRSELAV